MGSYPRFTHLGKTRMKIKKRLLWPKNHFKSLIMPYLKVSHCEINLFIMPDDYYALKMILKVSQCEIRICFCKKSNCACEIDLFIKKIVCCKQGLQRCRCQFNIEINMGICM